MIIDFDFVLHGRKNPFLSDLHTCHSLCIESESEFEFDHVSDFYAESEFDFEYCVVPLDVIHFSIYLMLFQYYCFIFKFIVLFMI